MSTPCLWDEYYLASATMLAVSGSSYQKIRNWQDRKIIAIGQINFTGRYEYTLLDALRVKIIHDLTTRVGMNTSDSAGAAELAVRYAIDKSSRDRLDRPIADPRSYSQSEALILAVIDGKMHVGHADPTLQSGYMDFKGEWARAHVVMPLAGAILDVLWRWLELSTTKQPVQ